MGSKHQLNPTLVFFFEMKKISFPKKIISVGSRAFQKKLQRLDQPTLVIFLTFFEKNYNNWIKGKLSKSKLRWTGLKYIYIPKCQNFFVLKNRNQKNRCTSQVKKKLLKSILPSSQITSNILMHSKCLIHSSEIGNRKTPDFE